MMKVTVDDVVIDRNTLDDVISKYRKDCNDFTYDYYQILRSDNEWITFDDFDGNKDCMHLKLMVAPGLHRHVAMVRQTGMKILDRNRINGQIYFAGFLYVDGEKANKYLTSLENPALLPIILNALRQAIEKYTLQRALMSVTAFH